jgi:hypothetical protein
MMATEANKPEFALLYHEPTCLSLVTRRSLDCQCNQTIVMTTEEGFRAVFCKSRRDRRKAKREAEKAIRKMKTNGR